MAQNSSYSASTTRSSAKSSKTSSTEASKASPRGSRTSSRALQFDQHAQTKPTVANLFHRAMFLVLMTLLISIASVVYIVFVFPVRLLRYLRRGRQAKTKHKLNEKIPMMVHEPPVGEDHPRDTVLLIHGFPDSPSLWTDTVSRLNAAGYRCVVVALPGCRGQCVQSMIQFSTIVERIHAAIKSTQASSVTVIGHDWGAVFARMLQKSSPSWFHRMILVDIVDVEEIMHSTLDVKLSFWPYVILFSIAYGIGHPFGSYLLQFVCMLGKYDVRPMSEIRSDMAWPYATLTLNTLRDLLHNFRGRSHAGHTDRGNDHGKSRKVQGSDQMATLYVYGTKKLFMYHTDDWIKHVLATPFGQVEKVDSDHWVMIRKKQEWNCMLLKWLERSNDRVRQ